MSISGLWPAKGDNWMKWRKLGKIISACDVDLPWYKKNTMVPVPYQLNSSVIRLFTTFCDNQNIGRIGYVDVNAHNPTEVLCVSDAPILDVGKPGLFDDNGVVTSSLYCGTEGLFLFYSGYQLQNKVPYTIFSGVAVSHDHGNSFTKLTDQVPLLDRKANEVFTRCAPFVMKISDDHFRYWYTSDSASGWISTNGKVQPIYDLKYFDTDELFGTEGKIGLLSVPLIESNEHGIAKSTIWLEDGVFKIIYSIRSTDFGYRLGYGESTDGKLFDRFDDRVGISISDSGWDSEMIAFAERFVFDDKVYLFYCGNHYGMDGMGCAILEENE